MTKTSLRVLATESRRTLSFTGRQTFSFAFGARRRSRDDGLRLTSFCCCRAISCRVAPVTPMCSADIAPDLLFWRDVLPIPNRLLKMMRAKLRRDDFTSAKPVLERIAEAYLRVVIT